MEQEQLSRLGIALCISVGAHLLFAVMAEAGSSGTAPKKVSAPPVEITRVAMDGSTLPSGKGNSSFNSPASVASPGLGETYNLDAGVPRRINIPKQEPTVTPPPQNAAQGQVPVNQNPPPQQNPNPQPNLNAYTPPVYAGGQGGTTPPSAPSRPSNAGNEGQKRSRGPNRVAFPEYTVEPSVSASMVTGGVTNSVDVSVDIAADGSHTEKIVRSSGSSEVDALVLAALAQWRWDPAAKEGQAIASTQNFKFTFKPR